MIETHQNIRVFTADSVTVKNYRGYLRCLQKAGSHLEPEEEAFAAKTHRAPLTLYRALWPLVNEALVDEKNTEDQRVQAYALIYAYCENCVGQSIKRLRWRFSEIGPDDCAEQQPLFNYICENTEDLIEAMIREGLLEHRHLQ